MKNGAEIVRRAIVVALAVLALSNQGNAFTRSRLLGLHGVDIVPAIVKGDAVYVKPMKGVTKETIFHLLGNDGKMYKLKVVDGNAKNYGDANWGFENNEAILLTGENGKLPDGRLVAVGKDVEALLHWYPSRNIKAEELDYDSDKYISLEGNYEMKKKIVSRIEGQTIQCYYASFRKTTIETDPCDPKAFKDQIGVLEKDDARKVVVESFMDCDGQPQDSNTYFPVGPVVGMFEVVSEGNKEIWFVAEAHGYEIYGIAFIQYYPLKNSIKDRYEFVVTGEL